MGRISTSLFRAFASLRHGAIIKMLLLSILVNALVLAALVFGIYWLLASTSFFGMWDTIADWGLTFFSGVFAYFLFPLLLPLIISFFDTSIADAIEREEYPNLPPKSPPYWPTIRQDVFFTGKVLLINIAVIPLYLLPGPNLIIYYLLNGYLIGSEFFHVAAGRHINRPEGDTLKRRHRLAIVGAGSMIVFASTIPLVNLVAPMIGVAMMVHFFHALKPPYKMEIETP